MESGRRAPVPEDTPLEIQQAFADHGRALFVFALNALGDHTEAQDCVQEAFIRAWRHRGQYRSEKSSVRTWLFAITRNLVIDALRARNRRPTPSDGKRIEWASKPLMEESGTVTRIAVYEALAKLTVAHREVIVAIQLEGLSYQDLSTLTGTPIPTLRTRMYYGLRSLRAALGEMTFNDRGPERE